MIRWRTARLEEVAEVLGGGTPSRQEVSYFGGGIPWATPTDITALNALHITKTKETITEDGLQNSSTKLLPKGAVLLTSRATIGYTAVAEVPICTNQGFVNFVCGPQLIPEFLAFWLRTQKNKMIQHAGGTTFKEIARGTLRKFEISFPPLDQQRRIADLLSRAEGIVRLRREAQTKAAQIIPALFLDMFGDPATNPKGWPRQRVGGAADVQGGLQVTAARATLPLERPYLRVANVYRSYLNLEEVKKIRLTESELARTRLQSGDLLIVEGHGNPLEVGRVAMWFDEIADCVHQNHLIRARPHKDVILPRYACAFLNSEAGRDALLRSGKTTSGLSTISTSNVKDAPILVPPLERQAHFESLCCGFLTLEKQQSDALAKAETTFNALLAKMFSEQNGVWHGCNAEEVVVQGC